MLKLIILPILFLAHTLQADFVRNNDTDTVYDTANDVTWQDNMIVQDNQLIWNDSLNYCQNLNFSGVTDWYLPHESQLITLIDNNNYPAINNAFINVTSSSYWTQTSEATTQSLARTVDFYSGNTSSLEKIYTSLVRCVRNGKINLNTPPTATSNNYSMLKNTSLRANIFTDTPIDYDADNDALVIDTFFNPSHGTVNIDTTGGFVYTPKKDFVGTDSFIYFIKDSHGARSSATIHIVVFNSFKEHLQQTNTLETTYTKELQEQSYSTQEYKQTVQKIKKELVKNNLVASVSEIADGNGLLVEYKAGHSGIIYSAPDGNKGSYKYDTNINSRLNIFQKKAEISGNKKVLAIAAQYWDWGDDDDVPQLAQMLSANGFDVTYQHYDSRQSGEINDFKNWKDYGIVLISSHGIATDSKKRVANAINMAIDLNIPLSEVSEEDLKEKKLVSWSNCNKDDGCHSSYLATNLFFEEYLQPLSNTLVYVSACHIGKHDAMAEILFDKGADTMIGYSDLVKVSFAEEHGIDIFTKIIGQQSLEDIFDIPVNKDISTGYFTGIKETDNTPAEIVVFKRNITDIKEFLLSKSFNITGTFSSYDFPNVSTAFDWIFTTTNGDVFQFLGKEPTSTDVFGWKQINSTITAPADWYMFPLNKDIDGDGTVKFDWILLSATGKAVYKLDGKNDQGGFQYSKKIDLNYVINDNKVIFQN